MDFFLGLAICRIARAQLPIEDRIANAPSCSQTWPSFPSAQCRSLSPSCEVERSSSTSICPTLTSPPPPRYPTIRGKLPAERAARAKIAPCLRLPAHRPALRHRPRKASCSHSQVQSIAKHLQRSTGSCGAARLCHVRRCACWCSPRAQLGYIWGVGTSAEEGGQITPRQHTVGKLGALY